MNRAERRRAKKAEKKNNNITYNFTKSQMDAAIEKALKSKIKSIEDKARENAANDAMVLMLSIPMKVLMDHYWQYSYEENIPKFAEQVIDYYSRWQDGEFDIEEMRKEIWDLAGIKIVRENEEEESN